MIVIVIIALTILAWLNRYAAKSFLYPPAFFAGLWAIYLLLLWLSGRVFFSVADDTLFFYFWGAVAFSTGGQVASFLSRMRTNRAAYTPVQPSQEQRRKVRRVLDVLLLTLVAAIPLYWHYVLQLATQANISNLWVAIRVQMIEAGESENSSSFRLMDNLVVLSLITALVTYYEDDGTRARRLRTYLAVGLALIYTSMTAARFSSICLIVSLVALNWLKRGGISRRAIIALSLVFVLVFSALGILLHKGAVRADETVWENVPALVDGFLWYTLGGIVAFDTVLHNPNSVPAVQNIDRPLLLAANKFGGRYDLPSRHAEFVAIGPGKDINIYTFYFSYFPRFGVMGTAVIVFLLGLAVTMVYQSASSGNPLAVVFFSILFSGIVLSEYAENLVLNLNFIAKALVFTWILYRWARGRRRDYAVPATELAPC